MKKDLKHTTKYTVGTSIPRDSRDTSNNIWCGLKPLKWPPASVSLLGVASFKMYSIISMQPSIRLERVHSRRVNFLFENYGFKLLVALAVLLASVSMTTAQSLASYIEEATANNPEIQAFELRYNRALEKVNEADWIPNTEVSAGYFISTPETRTGAQRARIGIKQMLPWFGTITARKNYASSLADTEFTQITIAQRKLALSVATSYYQLDNIHKELEILESNMQLLNTYEELALNAVSVDKATAVDVLKLQMRSNDIEQQIALRKEDLNSVQIAFNHLLNRDKNQPIFITERLQMPEEDIMYGDEELILNPELLIYDQLYESIAQSQLLNKREGAPEIGIGVDYLPVAQRPEMNFNDNGKDILMPMLTVSIPIFNKRYQSIARQNELRQQEIESQKDQRFKVLSSALAKAISQRNQARIKYLTQTKNIQQAAEAAEILIKKYETASIDFEELLNVQQLQLTFQLKRAAAIQEYFTQQSLVNYLINK